jgi:hypothetical protein
VLEPWRRRGTRNLRGFIVRTVKARLRDVVVDGSALS